MFSTRAGSLFYLSGRRAEAAPSARTSSPANHEDGRVGSNRRNIGG
jgi:hypothetical protein